MHYAGLPGKHTCIQSKHSEILILCCIVWWATNTSSSGVGGPIPTNLLRCCSTRHRMCIRSTRAQASWKRHCGRWVVYLYGEDGAVGPEELEQVLDVAAAREVAHEELPRARPLPRPAAQVLAGVCAQILPARRSVAARPLLLVLHLVTELRLRVRPPTLLLFLHHRFKNRWRWRTRARSRPRAETGDGRGSAGGEGELQAVGWRGDAAEMGRPGQVEEGVATIGGGRGGSGGHGGDG